jgi:ubiquinone/menaquinone biosynthesis C-methylase UbiE
MKELPYKDESFDCILAYHVISHTDTQGIKRILKELNRVLRKSGEFFITLCSKKA